MKDSDSITVRRTAPEGKCFITIWFDRDTYVPHHVFISVGKAGSALNAAADAIGRGFALAFRHGATVGLAAHMLQDISHDRTSNGYDAKSLGDALGQALRYFEEFVAQEEEHD